MDSLIQFSFCSFEQYCQEMKNVSHIIACGSIFACLLNLLRCPYNVHAERTFVRLIVVHYSVVFGLLVL